MKNLDLGLIGNSRTSALIDRQARIVWWCYPHFDSNPLCCSLLRPESNDSSPEAFGFTDVLFPDSHTVRQVYQRNSAILQTRKEDSTGNLIDIIDFAPRFYRHGSNYQACFRQTAHRCACASCLELWCGSRCGTLRGASHDVLRRCAIHARDHRCSCDSAD